MPSIGEPPSALPVITAVWRSLETIVRPRRQLAARTLLPPISLSLSFRPIRPDYTFRFRGIRAVVHFSRAVNWSN